MSLVASLTHNRSASRPKDKEDLGSSVTRHFMLRKPGSGKTKASDTLQDDYLRAMELIDAGDVKRFHSWLEEKVEEDGKDLLMQVDEHGWTLFHYACNSGKVIAALLRVYSKNADV